MVKDKYREQFAQATAEAFQAEYAEVCSKSNGNELFATDSIYDLLESPKDPSMGRFALPVFRFVKLLGNKPNDIANKIAISSNKILAARGDSLVQVEAQGGFLNARVDHESLAKEILEELLSSPEKYGTSEMGHGKKVLIEYSAPNIAKPFGITHLRTTIIGNSLRRLFKKLGYDVVGINYPGDWGTQFGKMIVAYQKWGDEETLCGDVIKKLLDLYVRFHQEAEKDSSYDDEAREAFRKLEKGDPEYVELWEKFKKISYAEFERVYDLMGVEFDLVIGESFLNDKMEPFIKRLEELNLVSVSEGALIVELDDPNLPPAMLRKADGATLYLTRDLAGAVYRWETFEFDQSLYVVGSSQADHFKQMLQVLHKVEEAEKLPPEKRMVDRIKHVDFGWVKFEKQQMATRQGNIIFLEDVFDKAIKLAKEIILDKNPELPEIDKTAKSIGIGAVFFSQLSLRRQKDVNFIWKEVLNFDGETGPYLQYTHARLCSLLRSYDGEINCEIDVSLLSGDEERRVIELIADYSVALRDAARLYEPFMIVNYLLKLASSFNKLYQRKDSQGKIVRIISNDKNLSSARIAIVRSVQVVLKDGLYLLGIEAPEEM